jgi:hypothetical protein
MIIVTILSGFDKISFKSAINTNFSSNSSSIFFLSSHANLFNLISSIASACISEKSKFAINAIFADSFVSAALIVLIISSIWSSALFNHSNI